MIFQEPMASLNPCFTVGFQIEEVLRVHIGLDRPARRERAHRAADAGRHPRRRQSGSNAFPHQMSGGQCQRVMIAMAIACNPKLLIADEPTTALDVTIQKQILDLLIGLQAEHGMGLIMITHDMGVVAETADRVDRAVQGPQDGGGRRAVAVRERRRAPTPARCSRRCPRTPPATACRPSPTSCRRQLRGARAMSASSSKAATSSATTMSAAACSARPDRARRQGRQLLASRRARRWPSSAKAAAASRRWRASSR